MTKGRITEQERQMLMRKNSPAQQALQSQKAALVEQTIKDEGVKLGNAILHEAVEQSKNPVQMEAEIKMYSYSSCYILASIAYNQIKSGRMTREQILENFKEEIGRDLDHIFGNENIIQLKKAGEKDAT